MHCGNRNTDAGLNIIRQSMDCTYDWIMEVILLIGSIEEGLLKFK